MLLSPATCGSGTLSSTAWPDARKTVAFIRQLLSFDNQSIIVHPVSRTAGCILSLLVFLWSKGIQMAATVLQIDRRDNVVVALQPLVAGDTVQFGDAGVTCPVTQAVP